MTEKIILKSLTMDQKRKAFEKARAKFNVPGAKLVLITEEYYDAALKFTEEHFIRHEPINKALGVPWIDEVEEFWLNALMRNLSLMIIDEESGEPLACQITSIARYEKMFDIESSQSPPFKELLRFLSFCDEHGNFFGHFGITEAFHILGLMVADKYKQRGLATHIVNAAMDMKRTFGVHPVYVIVEGTSNFSKKIFEKADFEILFEQSYATWEVEGKFPIQNTGIHKSMKVYGKKLAAEPRLN